MDGPNNLYDILGLCRDCSQKDIKSAYKKLALRYHPDKISKDAPENEKQKFIKISHAYEILIDDEKRFSYDTYGIINEQVPPMQNTNMADIFDFIMKTTKQTQSEIKKSDPIVVHVTLSLKELITGIRKTVLFDRKSLVEIATNKTVSVGEYKRLMFTCLQCEGSGVYVKTVQSRYMIYKQSSECSKCNGRGYINIYPDKYSIQLKKCKFDYTFKKEFIVQENIVLRELGHATFIPPYRNGDIILQVNYDTGIFKFDQFYNLHVKQDISIFELITGTKFIINHPKHNILIKMGPATPDLIKIVKGFGVPIQGSPIFWTDLFITLNVVYPEIDTRRKQYIRDTFADFYFKISDDGVCNAEEIV